MLNRNLYTNHRFSIRILSFTVLLVMMFLNLSSCAETLPEKQPTVSESPAPELSEKELVEQLAPSIVKVTCLAYDKKTVMSQGTGFFIDKRGMFVTAAHVLEGCYFINITDYNGKTFEVAQMYIYNNETSDHAICKAKGFSEGRPSAPVKFSDKASIGDKVYAFGYTAEDENPTFTRGTILNDNVTVGTKHYYENNAPITNGNSGGPLINSHGEVIGITTGIFQNGNYSCLKYENFKSEIKISYNYTAAPYEYFHNPKETVFSKIDHLNRYFSLILSKDNSVITLQYKYDIDKNTVVFQTSSVDIGIQIVGTYKYIEKDSDTPKTHTETYTLEFRFSNPYDMSISTYRKIPKSEFFTKNPHYTIIAENYDVDFLYGRGTMLEFD